MSTEIAKEPNKNMDLWDSVKETSPKWTKPGQNNLTAINGMYCIMRATEKFGPCGIGWGYEILEDRLDQGAEMIHDALKYNVTTHTIKIRLWYKWAGETGEVFHYGHTPFIMKSKRGPYQDDDPAKKSLTDAIKKCLSMIGIGADIHLGQFDDISYKHELELKAQQEVEKEQEAKEKAIKDDLSQYMVTARASYEVATTIPAINGLYKSDASHVRRECTRLGINPQPMVDALTESANNRKEKLK